MSKNIKGPKGSVFDEYEFVRCSILDACYVCEIGDIACYPKCAKITGDKAGNWIKSPPAPQSGPTVPGWYWVKFLINGYARPIEVNENDIANQCFGFVFAEDNVGTVIPFINCQFAPCTGKPEGWEK